MLTTGNEFMDHQLGTTAQMNAIHTTIYCIFQKMFERVMQNFSHHLEQYLDYKGHNLIKILFKT